MKKQAKLKLEKFTVSKIEKPNLIFGGDGGGDDDGSISRILQGNKTKEKDKPTSKK